MRTRSACWVNEWLTRIRSSSTVGAQDLYRCFCQPYDERCRDSDLPRSFRILAHGTAQTLMWVKGLGFSQTSMSNVAWRSVTTRVVDSLL